MANEIREYAEQLVADIARTGLNGRTFEQAMRDAHEARQATILETLAGQTDRGQAIRNEIAGRVYGRLASR